MKLGFPVGVGLLGGEGPHPEAAIHADGHPVGEHLFHHRLRAPQHELGVLGRRGVDEVH